MIDIFNDIATINKPVYHEGDAPKVLPVDFYTISEDYSSDSIHADNQTKQIKYEYTLKYYTKNVATLYSGLTNAISILKAKNYNIDGVGYDNLNYNEWLSRQVSVTKLEDL